MAVDEVRERASDWLIVGPVLGFTSQHTTRILAQPFDKHAGELELRIVEAAPHVRFDERREGFWPLDTVGPVRSVEPMRMGDFQTVVFEVDELSPGTRYFYEVVPKSAPAEVAGHFASKQPFSLRTLPDDVRQFKFSFHSCNGLHKPPRRGRPTAMWSRLLREAVEDPELHFAILGGDQVYADVIREEWQREWEPDFDPYDPDVIDSDDAARCREFFEDLPRRYEQIYRAFWRRPEIRTFMGHIPCVATWDDHEIYDGWGSYGNEHLIPQKKFFEAAAKSFDAFQLVLAPPQPLSSAAASHRQGHRAFSFMVGAVAFVVLDLRSQRNIKARGPSAVLGEAQWAWFDAELDEIAKRNAKQIVVVSSVPVVHMGGAAEHLLPNSAELYDDVLDHWSSRPNRSDQSRLLGKLFQVRKQTGANVLILGGDVHVGTIASILSSDRRFLLDDEGDGCGCT
ncbi:MAG TPA: alkaline phosphatase D family protein, partial [Enhygromyxa sp.]|nr:alkaline phosphatase D family protein [Enhygromyxa sp.]